jgi:hypothetical protein
MTTTAPTLTQDQEAKLRAVWIDAGAANLIAGLGAILRQRAHDMPGYAGDYYDRIACALDRAETIARTT